MKSHELVEKINNGEMKDGTKIKCIFKGRQLEVVRLCGDTLQFENGDYPKANMFLIPTKDWNGNEIDNYLYEHHNCFRTKAEAQEYLDYKNALEEVEKPFVKGKYNYCMSFINALILDYTSEFIRQGTTYLGQNKKVAQAFIDKWHDEILKYEFGIFE